MAARNGNAQEDAKRNCSRASSDRDFNHPSIVIWTIINENWGVDLVHDSDHREWLKRTFAWLKAYDPTRLVVDNSPLATSFHVESDIADYHFYAAIPDHRDEWDKFVDDSPRRALVALFAYGDGDHRPRAARCARSSATGACPTQDLRNQSGEEPWWFETGHDWGEGVMYAHGVENRFSDWSINRVFGDLRRFVMAAQWQQFRALKYQNQAMRRKPSLAGYVITELHDCHWESNGLLDMRRNPRVFHELFPIINSDTVIVPKWQRLSYWSGGENQSASLQSPTARDRSWNIARLSVCLGDETYASGSSAHRSAGGSRPWKHRTSRAGSTGSRPCGGSLSSSIILRTTRRPKSSRSCHSSRSAARPRYRHIWSGPKTRTFASIWKPWVIRSPVRCRNRKSSCAHDHDTAIADHVRQGASLLLLPENEISLYPFFPHWQNVRVKSRDGTLWRGDWLRRSHGCGGPVIFPASLAGPLLDETMDSVLPDSGDCRLQSSGFQARVFAGLSRRLDSQAGSAGGRAHLRQGADRGVDVPSCFKTNRWRTRPPRHFSTP